MKDMIRMKDLVTEGRKLQDEIKTKVNEKGNTPWGTVDPEIDSETGLVYANDIPLTFEDCIELYDIYVKTYKNVSTLISHHPGIQIVPVFEIELKGETDTHRFDSKQIRILYDFAIRNRQRIASRKGTPKEL